MQDITDYSLTYTFGTVGFISVYSVTNFYTYDRYGNIRDFAPTLSILYPLIFGISGALLMISLFKELKTFKKL